MIFDTLFLDRDGVINKKIDGDYVKTISDFEFIDDSVKGILLLSELFKRIIVVTNQQGIGKGLMTHDQLKKVHDYMCQKLQGKISKIYYCPHLEADSCSCRKPANGMLKKALQDFPDIIIKKSFLIGDSESDILAGRSMNISTVKVNKEFTLSSWANQILLAKG